MRQLADRLAIWFRLRDARWMSSSPAAGSRSAGIADQSTGAWLPASVRGVNAAIALYMGYPVRNNHGTCSHPDRNAVENLWKPTPPLPLQDDRVLVSRTLALGFVC